jgi:hypothetical protein
LPKATATPLPAATVTPTTVPATATSSPSPTLSPDEALATVTTLYETNNDCLLPCWWGFTPGISVWTDVKAALLPLANEIHEREDDSAALVTHGVVELPNTYYSGLDAGRSVGHAYLVKSGIIQAINVFVSEPTSLFTPVSIPLSLHFTLT